MPPTRKLPPEKCSVQSHCKNQQLSQAIDRCNIGYHKTKNISQQTFFYQQKLLNSHFFIYIHMVPKRHEYLTHHYLGNTKTNISLQQDIKIMPSLPPRKTSNYHQPITKHPAKQKIRNSISHCSHLSTHTHKPSILLIPPPLLKILPTNDPTTHPTHRKYHFPPLNLYIHLHALPQSVQIMLAIFSCVRNTSPHSIFNISIMHTPSYITITYT